MTATRPIWYRSGRFWDRFAAPFLAYCAFLWWLDGYPQGAAMWGSLSILSFICHWLYPRS